MANNDLVLNAKRVHQNNQEFLLGIFNIAHIFRFTRYSEYTILGFEEGNDNKPITNPEVQRKLNSSKVEAIADFLIHDPLAIFPTNLVIAIPQHVIDKFIEDDNNNVELHINEKVVKEIEKIDKKEKGDIYLSIIDGQHRVRGIEVAINRTKVLISHNERCARDTVDPAKREAYSLEYKNQREILKKLEQYELAVSFFIDPVLEYQAMIFSTINRTQTKVSPDLVYSLFGLTANDSPQKTALTIVNVLNGRETSPFYKRIRLAGSGSKEAKEFYKGGYPVLSQATIVKSILFYICKNTREADVERHKTRAYLYKTPNSELPFRKYYGENKDEKILKILLAYYSAVSKVFVDENGTPYWNFSDTEKRRPTNILHTRLGYEALLMILKNILPEVTEDNREKVETYVGYLEKAKDLDIKDDKEPKIYPFASKTRIKFYNDLGKKIWGTAFVPKSEVE